MGNEIRPQDGWNDFIVAVNGKQNDGSGNARVDRVDVQFNNNGAAVMGCTEQCNTLPNTSGGDTDPRTQNCADIGTDCFLVDSFTACGEKLTDIPGCTMEPDTVPNCNKSFTRTQTVANPGTGGTQTEEFYMDVMIPITAFTDQNGVRQIFCNTDINLALSTSTTVQNVFLKDGLPDCEAELPCNFGSTTPITLSYFSANSSGNKVVFNWTTGTETANAGFNIYYPGEEGRKRVNQEIILTKVMDSLTPVDYKFSAEVGADTFYISDVDVNNNEKLHGPFKVGEPYGVKRKIKKINWKEIASEHNFAKINRQNINKLNAVNKSAGFFTKTSSLSSAALPKAKILVTESGIQRITFQRLADVGLDLSGADPEQIALTSRGVPVQIFIDPAGEGGGAIEFIGEKLDSLYTYTNVYILEVDPELALRVNIDDASVKNSKKAAASYTETFIENNNNGYLESARNGDPWYDVLLIARPSSPSTKTYNFDIDNLIGNKGVVQVEINGAGDIKSINPDHHVTVSLNGVQIADELFEGFASEIITVDLNNTPAVLNNGSNELKITLPSDLFAFDLAYIDKFSVSYPRIPVAVDDRLTLGAKENAISVEGFSNSNIKAYRLEDELVSKLTSIDVADNGGGTFKATFKGKKNSEHQYLVSTEDALIVPDVELVNPGADINSGIAEYLIISHPDFIPGLADLISERETQFTVKLVDVEDIYTQYNFGIFDPEPIRGYIKHAEANMGTQYVLLVGADTYDYKKYLNPDSISFIPTIYASSEAAIQFAPSDSLLADVDGDNVQDVAIGRFPVRTLQDLEFIVSKTLDYPTSGHQKTALFVADKPDGGVSFSGSSNNLIDGLPLDWTVDTAYIEDLGVAAARTAISTAINSGRAYTSYMGHSDRTFWPFDGLYDIGEVAGLLNDGLPTVVSQYGCWNTYFVHPNAVSMAHQFLLTGTTGAAAVMGPTARTTIESDNTLGQVIIRNLFEDNMSVGMAIKEAKQELKGSYDTLRDVMIGWILLGDPALEIAD